MTIRGAMLLLILPLLLGSGPIRQTGVVGGVVTQAGDGTPVNLVGVHVAGLDLGAVTSTAGEFTLRGIPMGKHQLRFSRPCYHEVSVLFEVTEAVSQVRVDLGLPLSHAGVRMGLCG